MYRGFFINLNRNAARREAIERALAAAGAADRYERFEAVDGPDIARVDEYPTAITPGELGLWLTHERLAQAYRSADRHIHLIEDDIRLCTNLVPRIEDALTRIDGEHPDWDILFTEVFVPVDTAVYVVLHEALARYQQDGGGRAAELFPLDNFDFAGTTSMLINRRSIGKYADVLTGNWKLGRPIDLYLRDVVQQRRLRIFVTMPFLTSLCDDVESDIRGTDDLSRRVWNTYRRSYFIEADSRALAEQMQLLTRGVRTPPRGLIFSLAHHFALSDRHVRF
jgi:GR25 family glycosyltransferase involved in LPS biosynthesis